MGGVRWDPPIASRSTQNDFSMIFVNPSPQPNRLRNSHSRSRVDGGKSRAIGSGGTNRRRGMRARRAHAYRHRKEGDPGGAAYWYGRGEPVFAQNRWMLNGSALWETCWDRLERHWATTWLDSDAFQEARSAGAWLPGAFIIASRAADKSAISSFVVFARDLLRMVHSRLDVCLPQSGSRCSTD